MKRITLGLAAVFALLMTAGAAHAADVDNGKKLFKRCQACHKLEDGKNGVGPHLAGVIGRPVGSVENFRNYSDALKAWGAGRAWDEAMLAEFLANPRQTVKGTRMAFGGLKKQEQIDDVIAYIKSAQ